MIDLVNHPPHYTSHPSGVECVQITEHLGFLVGNAIKYLFRVDEKGAAVRDLEKALWYVQREIAALGLHQRPRISVYAYQEAWELTCKWKFHEEASHRRDAVVLIMQSQAQRMEDAVVGLEHASALITAEIELRTASAYQEVEGS